MPVQLGSAYGVVRIGSDTSGITQTQSALRSLQSGFAAAGASILRTGAALSAGLTLPIVGVSAAIFKLTSDFDTAMRNVNSIAQLPEAAFQELEAQVLSLSKTVPQSAETLAKGLYDIQSSGFQAADAMKILEVAAKGASAGLTTTDVSARALTAILNAYGKDVGEAQAVMDVLFKTVDRGVVSFEELANNIGSVAGTGNIAKVSIEEIGAAFATLTKGGISAAESETALNQLMLSFISPSKEAADAAKALGIDLSASALAAKGLAGVMEEVRLKTGGSAEAMSALFPNVRALKAALGLTRQEGKAFAEDLEAMGKAAGATDRAFQEQAKGVAFQMKILQNNIEAVGISLGTMFLPMINEAFGFVRAIVLPALERLVQWFGTLSPQVRTAAAVFAVLIAAAGPIAIVIGGIVALIGTLLSPIGLLILLVGALGAAFATNFMGIRDITTNAFNAVVGLVRTFVATLQQTGDPIQAVAAVLRQAFGPQAAEGFVAFVARVMEVAGQVRSALEQIGAAVGPSLGALGTFVQGTILPGLMMLASWFVSQGIPAFLLFASQVQTALMPVMAGLQAVFAALLPVFAQIGTLIQNVLIAGLPIAAQMINGVFIPALQLLWQIVSTLVLPLMGALARLVGSVLGVALQAIGAVLRNVIAPALALIAEYIVKDVLPQMQALASLITANVGPAIQWFVDNVLTPLQQALGFIIGLLESFSDWLNQIANQLANMQLPDWLQRHSPSPFEQTLMSANESLREMRRLAPDAFGAFPKANVVGMADSLPPRGGINVAGIGLNIQNLNVNDRGHAETLGRAYAVEVMRILDDVNTRGRSWAAHGA